MKEEGALLLNASRRCLRAGNFAAGFVVTGTEKVRCGFGNGDCLFFDFRHGTFAVADGSERFPGASRKILGNFGRKLAAGEETPSLEQLQGNIRGIYTEQEYNHKTTFSSVTFIEDEGELNIAVASGGDSLIMVIDLEEKKRRFKTAADMNFAGRSISAPSVNLVTIDPERERIILATDGFADYLRQVFGAPSVEECDLLYEESLETIIDVLAESREGLEGKIEYDDIGFIIINPCGKKSVVPVTVITGGTTSRQENLFSGPEAEDVLDEWLYLSSCRGAGNTGDALKRAGIGIYWNEGDEGIPV